MGGQATTPKKLKMRKPYTLVSAHAKKVNRNKE